MICSFQSVGRIRSIQCVSRPITIAQYVLSMLVIIFLWTFFLVYMKKVDTHTENKIYLVICKYPEGCCAGVHCVSKMSCPYLSVSKFTANMYGICLSLDFLYARKDEESYSIL